MPKTPSVILREELRKHGFELLDIYSYRDHDVVRVYDKQTGRIRVVESKKKISSMASEEDIKSFVAEIIKHA